MDPHVNSLANLEALLNICCNGCEILCITLGAPLLLMSWLPKVCGLRGYSLKLAGTALLMLVIGLGQPSVINFLIGSRSDVGIFAAVVLGGFLCAAMLGLGMAACFAPLLIALREGLKRQALIGGLNAAGFVLPIFWIAAFVICGIDYNRKLSSPEQSIE